MQAGLAGLEGAGGRDGVVQDVADLGQHVGVGVGDRRGQPEVLDQGGDLRVEPLEVAVDGLEVLADLVAAALERGGQRVERLVELGRLDRAQQRVEVGQHLLDLGGDDGALDGVAGLDRRRGRLVGDDEGDVLLAEERLGHDRGGDVVGDRVDLAREQAQGQLGTVGGGAHVEHLTHQDAADLHVGARGQLQADLRRLDLDPVVVGELLRERRVDEVDREDHQRQEDDAEDLVLAGEEGHPANLTVVLAPQIAIDSSRSITLIATMLVRTARPTATPTPAGPPPAL